jgi:hypothetical protein
MGPVMRSVPDGNICYHGWVPRGMSDTQIEQVTRQLLCEQHRVTVREVMQALRLRFGGCGRTERICRVLRQLEQERRASPPVPVDRAEFDRLREQLHTAQQRAALSEERERLHQDLWASRYAEKVAQLEQQSMRAAPAATGVTHDQYLRLYQRAVDLARRLAKYEDPDKPPFDLGD